MKLTNLFAVSKSIRIALASLLVALVISLSATAHAASIAGDNGYIATLYGNPFAGSTNSFGAIGGTVTEQYPISAVVSQRDARVASIGTAGQLSSTDGATSAYMQFVAAAPFMAGTVITYQPSWLEFNNSIGYNLKLDGITVQTGAGTPNTSPIVVTSRSATNAPVQTLKLDNMGMSPYSGSGSYTDMNEVLILPDALKVVAATASTPDPTSFGYVAPSVNDLNGLNGWISGITTASLTLTFSGTKTIQALVLTNFENTAVSFDIYNDANIRVALGSLIKDSFGGEFVGVKFNTPVTTSSLKFVLTGGNNSGFTEIIPLEAVPEPSSFMLGLLASVGLFHYRRRVGHTKS